MPNLTPAQLAALAALVGITPETHRHLYAPCCHQCNSIDLELTDAGYPSFHCQCGAWQFVEEAVFKPNFPALDIAAGDDVFLAPTMRWCTALDKPHGYFASVRFVPQVCGGWYCFVDAFVADSIGRREHEAFGDSQTLALLRACQSAGVPEICEIFGRKSDAD